MSYDTGANYQAGHNAGYDYGVRVERERTKQLRRDMLYFIDVAVDYIETIQAVPTEGIVEKFKQFREQVASDD